MVTVKSVSKKRYDILLIQANSGMYYIQTDKKSGNDTDSKMSDGIADLKIALHAFDVLLSELEGH